MNGKLLLDMDGVIVDFVRAACDVHNFAPEDIDWEECGWYLERGMGIPSGDFWAGIDSKGSAFWSKMRTYPWTHALVSMLVAWFGSHKFLFCTTPSSSPHSASGKVHKIKEEFGRYGVSRQYALTPKKTFLASPDTILIDDSDSNVEQFKLAGGHAILFPQPWNANRDLVYLHDDTDALLDWVVTQVNAIYR